MNLDLPHILVTAAVIGLALFLSGKLGWHEQGKFSWKLFAFIFVALLALNLLWPG